MRNSLHSQVVWVANAAEARESLQDREVGGVLCAMPLSSDTLTEALHRHVITKRSTLGPYDFVRGRPKHTGEAISAGLIRQAFAAGNEEMRVAFAEEAVRVMEFFSDVVRTSGITYRFRFVPQESLESRSHYDTSAVTLVRTLRGPGTWIHDKNGPGFQVSAMDLLLLKGVSFSSLGRKEALLHDYPASTEPGGHGNGRIVMVARSDHWRAAP